LSPTGVTIHEFFIEPTPYSFRKDDFPPLYRVVLGDLIESGERQTLQPASGSMGYYTKTGTIGFMDVRKNRKCIPIAASEDYSNELTQQVLCVEQVGIEPQFRRQGHASFLVRRAEELAREWGLDIVYMSMLSGDPKNGIMPDLIRDLLRRAGYTVIGFNQANAYKKLDG
jgi:ribosomal protein S18 acetylase RimI-like enzyme